jgi:hypothetical protein
VNIRVTFTCAAAVALTLPALHAQQTTTPAGQGGVIERAQVVRPEGQRVIVGAVETKIVTDRPYSAESVNQTVQVMADGNRIERTQVTRVYRDSAGRTRRDVYSADRSQVQTISIADPVAHNGYTLHPEKKIAYETGGNVVIPMTTAPQAPTVAQGGGGGGGGRGGFAATRPRDAAVAAPVVQGETVAPAQVRERRPAPDNPNVKTEDLGVQNVEGVLAAGKRTTTTIPAGQIGNVKDIQIVSEQWFSEELQVLVMTRHSDPRSGETIYRLRNILRAEPDASLFTVPSDYTVVRRGVRRPQ